MAFCTYQVNDSRWQNGIGIAERVAQHDAPEHIELAGIIGLDGMVAAVVYTRRCFIHPYLLLFVDEKLYGKQAGTLQCFHQFICDGLYFPDDLFGQNGGTYLVIEEVEYGVHDHFGWGEEYGIT